MATFAPTGLTYFSSLASPANSATAEIQFEWDSTLSGWANDVACVNAGNSSLVSPIGMDSCFTLSQKYIKFW
jgi:hypothetical protein